MLDGLHGTVSIHSEKIRRGMIRLGFIQGTSHIDNGFIWANYGDVIFKGRCSIAQNCSVRNGGGILTFGSNYSAGPNTKFICYKKITIGANTISSWDVTFCDYDFHAMKNSLTGVMQSPYGEIEIGHNNWICQNALVLKNTKTPSWITIAAGCVVSKHFHCKEKSVICGNPAKVIAEGEKYMDINDCRIQINN